MSLKGEAPPPVASVYIFSSLRRTSQLPPSVFRVCVWRRARSWIWGASPLFASGWISEIYGCFFFSHPAPPIKQAFGGLQPTLQQAGPETQRHAPTIRLQGETAVSLLEEGDTRGTQGTEGKGALPSTHTGQAQAPTCCSCVKVRRNGRFTSRSHTHTQHPPWYSTTTQRSSLLVLVRRKPERSRSRLAHRLRCKGSAAR